jgi:hypothetical protein
MANPCYKYCWRTHDVDLEKWTKWCRLWGKQWCFQKERGEETHREHFQGVISLKVKKRKGEILKDMQAKGLAPEYLEVMSTAAVEYEDLYVTKEETRIGGPWNDRTDAEENIYWPRQYRNKELWPWQQQIVDSCDDFNDRHCNVLYDPRGASGKSTVAAICHLRRKGIRLPSYNDAKELSAALCDVLMAREIRIPGAIFFNLERSMDQKHLAGMYTAIECIKDGCVADSRYKYREWWFDSPTVWVFCNTLPMINALSHDRWKVWYIGGEDKLQEFDFKQHSDVQEYKRKRKNEKSGEAGAPP